jgi:hypothetical protein
LFSACGSIVKPKSTGKSHREPSARPEGKKGQGPTATLAFMAFLAMWFV